MAELTEKDNELIAHLMTDGDETPSEIKLEDVVPPLQVLDILKNGRLIPGVSEGLTHVPEELLALIDKKDKEFLMGFAACAHFLNAGAQYFIFEALSKVALESPEEPAGELELNSFTFVTVIQGLLYRLSERLARVGYVDAHATIEEETIEFNKEAEASDGGDSVERPGGEDAVRGSDDESGSSEEVSEEIQADS